MSTGPAEPPAGPAAPGRAAPPALELRGIDKRFGAVHASRAVSLAVAAGSVHGLIGENGAGKSTLMNIVYGYHRADAGEIRIAGRPTEIRRPHDAIAAGVGMVHQHFMLVENLTVLENVVLGAEGGRRLAGGLARARAALERLAREHGLAVPLDTPVDQLPVGVQQRVEILKALHRGAELLILDEPTAVLTPQETAQLFTLLARLRERGRTVILVTHKLREIMAVTDRVTVLRQGAVVHETPTRATSEAELAEKMVGRAVALTVEKSAARPGGVRLAVNDLEVRDHLGVPRVRRATFALRAGEILGIAGVAGNGQTELLEALAGIATPSRGEIVFAGRKLAGTGVRERRRLGLAHVPEDRLRLGVIGEFTAAENAILGQQDRPAFSRAGFLRRAAIAADCRRKMRDYDVRPPEPEIRLAAFSGGNQQKLVLAREFDGDPQVLLVGQPTRGVDIGAVEFIHRRLVALRDAGKAILLVSTELDEILGLADRILVMFGGEIVADLPRAATTEARLGRLMAGLPEGAA